MYPSNVLHLPLADKLAGIHNAQPGPVITPINSQWIMPGEIITVAPDVHMAIAYDQVINGIHNTYTPRFKFWYQGKRTKDYTLDHNRQIDMQHSIGRIITLIITRNDPNTGKPVESHIEVARVDYRWDR